MRANLPLLIRIDSLVSSTAKRNQGILTLRRELILLAKLRRRDIYPTVASYKPRRVETKVRACCKEHPNCPHQTECTTLWDAWSTRAPIKYSPARLEKAIRNAATPREALALFLGIS